MMSVPYIQQAYTGKSPSRAGIAHPSIAPYDIFTAADGKPFVLAIQSDREWQHLCHSVLKRPALAAHPQYRSVPLRVEHRRQLCDEISAILCISDRAAVMAQLVANGIACGALNTVADLVAHPQLQLTAAQTSDGNV